MTPEQQNFYAMETLRTGAILYHALQLLYDQKLTTPTRRALGVSAKRYLVDHYLHEGRLSETDPRAEDLFEGLRPRFSRISADAKTLHCEAERI